MPGLQPRTGHRASKKSWAPNDVTYSSRRLDGPSCQKAPVMPLGCASVDSNEYGEFTRCLGL